MIRIMGVIDTETKIQNLTIRRFKEEDREGIQQIYKRFFEDTPPHSHSSDGFLVAKIELDVVGFVLISYHPEPPNHSRQEPEISTHCYLEELHVHHDHYGKGIGTALTQKAIEYALSKNADAIYVATNYWNEPAIRTYIKCGFQEQDRTIRFGLSLQDTEPGTQKQFASDKYTIRFFQEEDIDTLISIATIGLWVTEKNAKEVISWAPKSDKADLLVAESEGKPVGFLTLKWGKMGWAGVADIGWIAVSTSHQRRGIGTALIKKSEELAKNKGLRKIYVVTSMDDIGPVCFYIKNGFRFEGLMKDYEKDHEESVMLGKHL